MKICPRCDTPKDSSEFQKDKSRKDGLYPICRLCRNSNLKAQYPSKREQLCAKRKTRYASSVEEREKQKTASKEFRRQHPEYGKGYLRKYYAEHKNYFQAYSKKRYWSDPERFRAESRDYREKNLEKVQASVRAWFEKHPHAATQAANKRRAYVARTEDTLTGTQLQETLTYFDHKCGYCLVDLRTLPKRWRTWDHITPISHGGGHTQDNVIPCCKSCNSRKKDRPIFTMARYASKPPRSVVPAAPPTT